MEHSCVEHADMLCAFRDEQLSLMTHKQLAALGLTFQFGILGPGKKTKSREIELIRRHVQTGGLLPWPCMPVTLL